MAAPEKFIAGAIKRPGALTAAVGGPPSKNLAKVRQLAKSGSPQEKREAQFYLNVLAKAAHKRKKGKAARPDEVAVAKAHMAKRATAAALKRKEAALESTPVKTAAEKRLEQEISRRTGSRYVGKR